MDLVSNHRLADPIQHMHAEHEQVRAVCDRLDRLADDIHHDEAHKEAALIVEYLTRHLPLHLADQEEDFFPLLLARCQPEDAANEIVTLLRQERRKPENLIDGLVGDLARLAAGRLPERPLDFVWRLMTFAEFHRRHTAWAEATVLRLARLRLDAEDRAQLAQRIAGRRAALDAAWRDNRPGGIAPFAVRDDRPSPSSGRARVMNGPITNNDRMPR